MRWDRVFNYIKMENTNQDQTDNHRQNENWHSRKRRRCPAAARTARPSSLQDQNQQQLINENSHRLWHKNTSALPIIAYILNSWIFEKLYKIKVIKRTFLIMYQFYLICTFWFKSNKNKYPFSITLQDISQYDSPYSSLTAHFYRFLSSNHKHFAYLICASLCFNMLQCAFFPLDGSNTTITDGKGFLDATLTCS